MALLPIVVYVLSLVGLVVFAERRRRQAIGEYLGSQKTRQSTADQVQAAKKAQLIAQLKAAQIQYFEDDPEQFWVDALAAFCRYVDDQDATDETRRFIGAAHEGWRIKGDYAEEFPSGVDPDTWSVGLWDDEGNVIQHKPEA